MKKLLTFVALTVMTVMILTGCGNPVYDDLVNFLNVEMVDVNANYEKIKEEAGKWENLEEDAEFEASINDNILPFVNDSLEKLEKITPATEEVKDLKDKYVNSMKSYKEGFEEFVLGIQQLDENKVNSANEKINKGLEQFEEYSKALDNLAEEVGAELEY